MEASINKVYKDNKAARVGADIICPVCGQIFRKIQYSQPSAAEPVKTPSTTPRSTGTASPGNLTPSGCLTP